MWRHMCRNQFSSFAQNGRVHLNRPEGVSSVDCWQPEVCVSAVVMLDTPCSEVVWRVLATHSIRHFPLHFPYRALLCAITFQLQSTQFDPIRIIYICLVLNEGIMMCLYFNQRYTVYASTIYFILKQAYMFWLKFSHLQALKTFFVTRCSAQFEIP
jgi:hypothetical protein